MKELGWGLEDKDRRSDCESWTMEMVFELGLGMWVDMEISGDFWALLFFFILATSLVLPPKKSICFILCKEQFQKFDE